jgi:hypothetical protein
MCNRSYGSAVLISMASYQGESCKTGMHSVRSPVPHSFAVWTTADSALVCPIGETEYPKSSHHHPSAMSVAITEAITTLAEAERRFGLTRTEDGL